MFNYIHNESITVNTELGAIKLTYIVVAQLPKNVFGEQAIPQGMEGHNTYFEAFRPARNPGSRCYRRAGRQRSLQDRSGTKIQQS